MSYDSPASQEEQQHHVITYFLETLEQCADKSGLWRLIHASDLRRKLLRKSKRVSKLYSISEDAVRQCVEQIFVDVDHCVTQFHRLIYSPLSDDSMPLLDNINKKNTVWHTMQIERARQLFPTQQHLDDNDLLENYFIHIREKLTPKQNLSNSERSNQVRPNPFDLNIAYEQENDKGKEYLRNIIQNFRERKTPDLRIIDEMIKLGKKMQYVSIIHITISF